MPRCNTSTTNHRRQHHQFNRRVQESLRETTSPVQQACAGKSTGDRRVITDGPARKPLYPVVRLSRRRHLYKREVSPRLKFLLPRAVSRQCSLPFLRSQGKWDGRGRGHAPGGRRSQRNVSICRCRRINGYRMRHGCTRCIIMSRMRA